MLCYWMQAGRVIGKTGPNLGINQLEIFLTTLSFLGGAGCQLLPQWASLLAIGNCQYAGRGGRGGRRGRGGGASQEGFFDISNALPSAMITKPLTSAWNQRFFDALWRFLAHCHRVNPRGEFNLSRRRDARLFNKKENMKENRRKWIEAGFDYLAVDFIVNFIS